jgi:Zn-dependent M32 family carboxypeptidase
MVESSHKDTQLQAVFQSYSAGATMEGKQFAKLMKDCKILDKKVTSTDIDLIFAKIKEKAARRISFTEF